MPQLVICMRTSLGPLWRRVNLKGFIGSSPLALAYLCTPQVNHNTEVHHQQYITSLVAVLRSSLLPLMKAHAKSSRTVMQRTRKGRSTVVQGDFMPSQEVNAKAHLRIKQLGGDGRSRVSKCFGGSSHLQLLWRNAAHPMAGLPSG